MRNRDALTAVLKVDFNSFLRKAVGTINAGTPFEANWHIEAIVHQLDSVAEGKVRRLIINQPPRSLKSITASVAYVAWRLGRDPTLRIIVVSYNGRFAAELHRQFRVLVESDWYRQTFSGVRWAKRTDNEFVTTDGGGRFATSIGGELTGRGGDLLILDDPMNAAEVNSEPARRKTIDFFATSLISRLNNKISGAIIVVMQRLHEGDLVGHLLQQGGWEHLNLPAIASQTIDIAIGFGRVYHREEGEALHAAREDLATLDDLKREMGSIVFSAQYQQAPVPADGNVVSRGWIEAAAYEVLPKLEGIAHIVQSWDIAIMTGATNDYSVCTTWVVTKSDVYLIDVWRGRLIFPDLRRKVVELAHRYKPVTILIENAGPGQSLLQDLQRETPLGMVRPIGIKPEGSKEDRMSAPSARFEAGMVHLPKQAPWLDEYLLELLGFPTAGHDDQVDSTSQLLNWWWNRWRRERPVIAMPIIVTAPYEYFSAPRFW